MTYASFVSSATTTVSSSVACAAAALTGAGGGGQYFNFVYAASRSAFNVGIRLSDLSLRGKRMVLSFLDDNMVGSVPRAIIVSAAAQ